MRTLLRFLLPICGIITLYSAAKAQNINAGRIPFKYYQNCILLDAVINDTVQTKVFFDTGVHGLIVADSLNVYGGSSETAKYLQIGKERKKYYDYPNGNLDHMTQKNPVFGFLGVGAIVGRDFFDGKIIRISYNRQSIEILNHSDELTGYQKLEMYKEDDKWGIPVIVVLQGKSIAEYMLVDTGNTGILTLNAHLKDKYAIDLTSSLQGSTNTAAGSEQRSIITCDTIRVGNSFMTDQRVAFRDTSRRAPFAGLLGNSFLCRHDLILDFKNGICYIKNSPQ